MAKYIGTVMAKELNVRNVPDSKYNVPIRKLKQGAKVEADRLEGNWWHITKVNDVDVLEVSWAFAGDRGGYIRLDVANLAESTVPVSRTEAWMLAVDAWARRHGYDGVKP